MCTSCGWLCSICVHPVVGCVYVYPVAGWLCSTYLHHVDGCVQHVYILWLVVFNMCTSCGWLCSICVHPVVGCVYVYPVAGWLCSTCVHPVVGCVQHVYILWLVVFNMCTSCGWLCICISCSWLVVFNISTSCSWLCSTCVHPVVGCVQHVYIM